MMLNACSHKIIEPDMGDLYVEKNQRSLLKSLRDDL